jgi:hypothetical protein
MTVTTEVNELVINKLTKAQYDAIENPSDTELYYITDASMSYNDLTDKPVISTDSSLESSNTMYAWKHTDSQTSIESFLYTKRVEPIIGDMTYEYYNDSWIERQSIVSGDGEYDIGYSYHKSEYGDYLLREDTMPIIGGAPRYYRDESSDIENTPYGTSSNKNAVSEAAIKHYVDEKSRDYYTKAEVDAMIGNIEAILQRLNSGNNS